jgi:hypothetical protein
VARGRDPYFPPWPDVVQLDAFSAELREAVAELLIGVGDQCDGVRCDMAMLMTNEVFARTWRESPPADEFRPPLIARVTAAHPGFAFVAEAYGDMEWTLQPQGFDHCWGELAGRAWALADRLGGQRFGRSGDELAVDGLYSPSTPGPPTSFSSSRPASPGRGLRT